MNKIFLCGRMTKDPELRETNSGINVATFGIAVDRRGRANGERQVDFFDCVAWRQTADFITAHFSKGRRILIEGSLQTREYTAQDGTKRKIMEVIVDSCEFADSKPEAQAAQKPAEPQFTEVTDDGPDDLPF